MNRHKGSTKAYSIQRQKAEEILKKKTSVLDSKHTEFETKNIIQDSEVQQIELQMQNDELLKAKEIVEVASEKYTNLYNTAPLGYFTLSREGVILELNLSGSQLLGKGHDELINSQFGFFISEETRPIFNFFLNKIFKQKTKERCQVTLLTFGKLGLYVSLTGIITKNEDQCAISMIDITELKQAEMVLRKNDINNRSVILNSALEGFWLLDMNGRLLEVNETYCKMSGYSDQELLTMRVIDLEAFENKDKTAAHILKIIEQGEDRFESRHRRKDGSIFDVEVSVQYKEKEGGRMLAFLHYISERKQAEKQLQINEDKYKSLFYDNHSILLLIDPDTGEIKDANPAACNYYGWSLSEICSKNISDINTLSEKELKEEMQNAKSEKRNHFFFKHRLANGEIRDVDIYSNKIIYNDSILLFSIINDITERKLIEDTLKENENRRLNILEAAMDGFWLSDIQGNLLEVNEIYCKMSGYSKQELLAMNFLELEDLESADENATHIHKIVSEGEDRFESRHRRKDGTVYDVEVSVQYQPEKGGQFITFIHDITERKQAEAALKESEERVKFKLQSILSPDGNIADLEMIDIIDAPSIQKLMKYFYELTQIPFAIIDVKGTILVGVGWQDVCTKFHRVHPESCKNCIESDVFLTRDIPYGEFKLYKCKNNMWDMATPLIIGGEHKGNLFIGQFFIDKEPIDYNFFRNQARRYGFDENEYLKTIDKVPRLSKQKLEHAKAFLLDFSFTISQLSYSNIKLARAITQQQKVEDALRESEDKYRNLVLDMQIGVILHGPQAEVLLCNPKALELLGVSEVELLGKTTFEPAWNVIHEDGKPFIDSEHPVYQSIATLMPVKDVVMGIYHHIKGKRVWLLMHAEPQLNDNQTIRQVVCTFIDITSRKEMEAELKESEFLFRESQQAAFIGSYKANFETALWETSEVLDQIFGIDKNYIRNIEGWLNIIHPEDKYMMKHYLMNDVLKEDVPFNKEFRIIRKNDGEKRWIHGLGKFELDIYNNVKSLVGTIQDITERKVKEETLRKLNKTLSALNRSSKAMSQSHDEVGYLNKVCNIIVDDTDFTMVWIGYAENNEAKSIVPMASAGFENDYLETIKISWDDSEFGQGPTGVAIRTGEIGICNNMFTDPDFEPWREQALKRGYASSIVLPLKSEDKVFGAISIYSKEPDSFLEDEIKLLSKLANDLSHGITTIRLKEANKLAEIALIKSHGELEERVKERTDALLKSNIILQKTELKYRTVADFAYNWEFWIDQNGNMLYCSPSCERITGYKVSEFVENPGLMLNIIFPDDLNDYKKHKNIEDNAHECKIEIQYRIVCRDGTIKWIGHVCQPIFDKTAKFIGTRGSNKDISERKKIEHELRTSNQKYNLLSENITDGIFICKNGCFDYVNKAVADIFGYEMNELIGVKLTQLVMLDYQEELVNFMNNNETHNETLNIEIVCLKKDFTMVFVEIFLNFVSNEGAIYGVIHDITEKKELQKNIVKAIIQTEEKERAYFSKELHDGLGPLLSTIKLYLQWAERPKRNKSVEEIISNARNILEDALETVKEISNKLSPHLLANYGLTSAIQSFIDKLQETSEVNILFQTNLSRRMNNEIEAALYRAVIECINNTLKHAKAKNITIDLDDTGSKLYLQYRDDGKGYDVAKTLTEHKGLGLFNLQNRIQSIGGRIKMLSKPGHGIDYQITVSL